MHPVESRLSGFSVNVGLVLWQQGTGPAVGVQKTGVGGGGSAVNVLGLSHARWVRMLVGYGVTARVLVTCGFLVGFAILRCSAGWLSFDRMEATGTSTAHCHVVAECVRASLQDQRLTQLSEQDPLNAKRRPTSHLSNHFPGAVHRRLDVVWDAAIWNQVLKSLSPLPRTRWRG